jgi:hypothetical protein
MLITISGMVGSGKSTTAARVVELLREAGLDAQPHRFRFLNVAGFEKRRTETSKTAPRVDGDGPSRGSGFAVRRLTASRFAGYAMRVVSFRLSSFGSSSRCDVLDRYFYDNFVQYSLTSPAERVYLRLLRWLIPKPDTAILLVASDATISLRRPDYLADYVTAAGRRYRDLPSVFPNLVTLRTDVDQPNDEEIRSIVRHVVERQRRGR